MFAELLAGCATEDAASVAVLFADSAAEESASRISLLMASWLCGMSRYLLLEEKFCWLSELSFVGPFGTVSDVGSVDISPSQANIVTDVTIPSDVANAFFAMEERFTRFSTFFFSIFKTKLLLP